MSKALFNSNGYCKSEGYVVVYSYDDQGVYAGKYNTFISLHTGIPGNSITLAPPDDLVAYKFQHAILVACEDYRGRTAYRVPGGERFTVEKAGPLKDAVLEAPPSVKPGESLRYDNGWAIARPDEETQAQIDLANRLAHNQYVLAAGHCLTEDMKRETYNLLDKTGQNVEGHRLSGETIHAGQLSELLKGIRPADIYVKGSGEDDISHMSLRGALRFYICDGPYVLKVKLYDGSVKSLRLSKGMSCILSYGEDGAFVNIVDTGEVISAYSI